MLVRDDLKAMGINIKHFTRWLQKLTDDGLVIQNGDHLMLHSHHEIGCKSEEVVGKVESGTPYSQLFPCIHPESGGYAQTRVSTGLSRYFQKTGMDHGGIQKWGE